MSQEPLAMERCLLGEPTVETKMVLEWLVDNRWKPSHPHTPSSSRYRLDSGTGAQGEGKQKCEVFHP